MLQRFCKTVGLALLLSTLPSAWAADAPASAPIKASRSGAASAAASSAPLSGVSVPNVTVPVVTMPAVTMPSVTLPGMASGGPAARASAAPAAPVRSATAASAAVAGAAAASATAGSALAAGLPASAPSAAAAAADAASTPSVASAASAPEAATLDGRVQDVKSDVIKLNRDLLVLEEELLFPANTQVALFVSMDVGKMFDLDSVQIKLDDKPIANYLYTALEVQALHRGGVQRLYLGNLRTGPHEIIAFFTGKGPHERDYKRGATVKFEKGTEAKYIELRITDSTGQLQPEFDVKLWQ